MKTQLLAVLIGLVCYSVPVACWAQDRAGEDPLPSWNDGETKAAIIAFVERVTDENSDGFVPAHDRIATFDNDGTLWAEKPVYFQAIFALDEIKKMAGDHPEWKTKEPFRSVLADDIKAVLATGKKGLLEVLAVSHSGITTTQFNEAVRHWLETAKHPTTHRPYTQMVYQPMLELLAYLRANGFKTFIVSGGGVEFMRVFTDKVYGIPSEQVVGSSGKVKFEMRDGIPTLVKLPEINFIDDKDGKPVGIELFIGRRPIFAVGNSDGDKEMLEYTTIAESAEDKTPRFGMIIHHTDAKREWAYDRDSDVGRLDKALDEAPKRGWTVVSMKDDWKVIFPAE